MSLTFSISSNGDVVAKSVTGLGLRLSKPQKALESFGRHMVNVSVPENFAVGGRPEKWPRSSWSSEKGQMDTGRLIRSVRFEVGERYIRVGSNLSYAAQRQHGGVIKAKKGKFLTVPFPGVPRAMARPSRWGERLFRPGKPGPEQPRVLGIMSRKKFVPKFALVASVKQPPRPFVLIHDGDVVVLHQLVVKAAVAEFEAGR